MEFFASDGRIMLRRPGFNLPPHRDPKWGFLTCLLYLPRASDSEAWGTRLYRVEGDGDAQGVKPHWIKPEQCRAVADVPFRANTMFIFLNSAGAHGASIAEDAQPPDLERYAYQFRIGPSRPAMDALIPLLPDERRAEWTGKLTDY
jgi:hypothetical protein